MKQVGSRIVGTHSLPAGWWILPCVVMGGGLWYQAIQAAIGLVSL